MDDETRRVDQIEAEIAETRVELAETIGALQDRLTPANLVANARETVTQAATEKVRHMTDNSFIDTVRSNPIPAAMIGLGAAWLYLKGRSNSGNGYSSNHYRGSYPSNVQRYGGGMYDESGYSSGMGAVGTSGRGGYGAVADIDIEETSGINAGSSMGSGTGSAGNIASNVASRASHVVDEARDTMRQTTRRAQVTFNDVLQDNPLMLGAAAALLGAAVGMTVPATQAENRLMGEARDAVVDRAQNLASDAANRVSEAASNVQETAAKVADTAQNIASGTGSGSGTGASTGSGTGIGSGIGTGSGSQGAQGTGGAWSPEATSESTTAGGTGTGTTRRRSTTRTT